MLPAGPSDAKEGFAVAAAEQEDEPLQVAARLGQAVGGCPVPEILRYCHRAQRH